MTHRIDRLVSTQADLRTHVVDTLLRAARRLCVGAKRQRTAGAPPHEPRIQDWPLDEIELSTRVAHALEAENKRDRQHPVT